MSFLHRFPPTFEEHNRGPHCHSKRRFADRWQGYQRGILSYSVLSVLNKYEMLQIDEEELRVEALKVKEKGLNAVVIVGVFSPLGKGSVCMVNVIV